MFYCALQIYNKKDYNQQKRLLILNLNNFGARLGSVLKHYNVSNIDFADKIGVTANTVSRYITGKSTPNLTVIDKILDFFDEVNPSWLVLGRVEMFKKYYKTVVDVKMFQECPREVKYFLLLLDDKLNELKTDNYVIALNEFNKLLFLLEKVMKLEDGVEYQESFVDIDSLDKYFSIMYNFGVENSYVGIANVELG